jgi:diketogulonate reductase-like aldo/keto reductase
MQSVQKVEAEFTQLNSGHFIPMVGLGTWNITGESEVRKSILSALDNGYRHFDTAQMYLNEEDIGKVLREEI